MNIDDALNLMHTREGRGLKERGRHDKSDGLDCVWIE